MAVAEMKRIQILLMRRDQEKLISMLQRFGCVHLTQVEAPDGEFQPAAGLTEAQVAEDLNSLRWAITRLSRFDKEKRSMFAPLPEAQVALLEEREQPDAMDVVRRVEQLERRAGDLRGQETRLRLQAEQMLPWLSLDVPAQELRDTASTRVLTGHANARGLAQLEEDWRGRSAIVRTLHTERDEAYFLAFVHRSEAEDFLSGLRAAGYQHAAPPPGRGTAAQQHEAALAELSGLEAGAREVDAELTVLAENLPKLRLAYEALVARQQRLEARARMAHTASASLLSGWVPAHVSKSLAQKVSESFPDAQVSLTDPEEGEEPPVLLRNNALVRPYEAVVTGFSLPAPDAVDPTAVMMPFFACFFGMMVSDAGYGLVMAILIPILVKIMKPSEGGRKIFWILAGGGLSTILWGALYNTWFGFAPWPTVFDPVNNSLPVMAVCVGIGALHLFAGLGLGIYQNIRAGNPLDALYDQVSWMMVVVGLGLLALPQTAAVGKWLALAGALIVLLTAGRNKSKNPVKRLLSGLGALYGVTSWISDLLSYMRLFGMGLATGVIGMVINQLVGMIMGGGIIGKVLGAAIFVGAHLFNAAINILGAYVHACRLQYIEFFGKFYQEGGKPFNPLRFSPRYVRLAERD